MENCTPALIALGQKLEHLFNNMNSYDATSWKAHAHQGLTELAGLYKEATAGNEEAIVLPELNECPAE